VGRALLGQKARRGRGEGFPLKGRDEVEKRVARPLVTVDLDALLRLLLGQELGVDEKLSDRRPLVALELDDLARLGVLDDGAVAGKLLRVGRGRGGGRGEADREEGASQQ